MGPGRSGMPHPEKMVIASNIIVKSVKGLIAVLFVPCEILGLVTTWASVTVCGSTGAGPFYDHDHPRHFVFYMKR